MLLETLNDEHFDDFIIFTQGKHRMNSSKENAAVTPSYDKTEKKNAE